MKLHEETKLGTKEIPERVEEKKVEDGWRTAGKARTGNKIRKYTGKLRDEEVFSNRKRVYL
jgi:hypothetical protein